MKKEWEEMKSLKSLETDAESQLTAFEARVVAKDEVSIKRFVKAIAEREGVDFIELVSSCVGLEGLHCKFIFLGCVEIYLNPCCKTHSDRDLRWEGENWLGIIVGKCGAIGATYKTWEQPLS